MLLAWIAPPTPPHPRAPSGGASCVTFLIPWFDPPFPPPLFLLQFYLMLLGGTFYSFLGHSPLSLGLSLDWIIILAKILVITMIRRTMNRHFQDLRKRLSTCRMFSHRILTTAQLCWCCGSSKPTSPKLRLLLPPEKHSNWGFGLLHDAHQVSITKQHQE